MAFDRDECIIGYGKSIGYSDTQGGGLTMVDGTIEISYPESELGKAEITNDDSPDFHKDYIPGLYEPGTVKVTYRYTSSIYTQMQTVYQLASVAATRASATKYWTIELPDGATTEFRGFISKNNLPIPDLEGSPICEMEIQVGGSSTTEQGTQS